MLYFVAQNDSMFIILAFGDKKPQNFFPKIKFEKVENVFRGFHT